MNQVNLIFSLSQEPRSIIPDGGKIKLPRLYTVRAQDSPPSDMSDELMDVGPSPSRLLGLPFPGRLVDGVYEVVRYEM